jgi:tetratricopeptide (TPR) repeat protein
MLARSLLEARAGRAGESWEKAVREAAEPAMDAKRGWEGRRKTSVPPRDRAGDIADTVLALEEELNGERRALVLQAARTLLAGGNRSGPWSAVMTAAVGVGRPTLSTRQEATAWRVCGLARCARGEWGRATADLDAALSLAPADRAARRVRARAWVELRESDKAITDCTAGLDARPYSWELWYLRALAYRQLNRPALALADLTEALARGGDGPAVRLERMRTEFEVRTNLGNDSTTKGDLAGAIAAYRAAVAIDPKSASAHMNLANALHNKGLFDEAIAAYREVIALDPRHVNGHLNLGRLLSHKGRNEEAIACLRKLVELVPHVGLVHNSLGDALRVRGHFDEALKSYRRCLELGNADEAKLAIQQRLVDETERLIPLAPRLRAFLTGAARPADAAEAIDLARLCCYTKRYAAASRFYAEAFAAQPTLASDLKSGHRYNAACYATQAGCGKGKDDAKPDHQERAKLREQALAWLAADLALRKEQLAGGKPQAPQTVATTMLHWQRDGDLTGIRDSAGLAELPADEKKRCEQLWAQVAALLRKAQKG